MRILITGATGFVGGKVLEKLIARYGAQNIIALSSKPVPSVKSIAATEYSFDPDYLQQQGAGDTDILLHIGAFIPKTASDANELSATTGNIEGTQRLLNSVLPSLKRIVFVSTLDVYADFDGVIDEDTDTVPQTMYGWSKLYCEKMVQAFCQQNLCSYAILRLGHVYGEGEEKYRKVMPVMIRNAIEGKDLLIYGDGEAIRSFIYIEDVAEAIVNAVELKSSEIINVVGNEAVTINMLAEIIKEFADHRVQIIHMESGAKNKNYVVDNGRLRNLLIPELIPLRDGLRREYNYMEKKIYEDHI